MSHRRFSAGSEVLDNPSPGGENLSDCHTFLCQTAGHGISCTPAERPDSGARRGFPKSPAHTYGPEGRPAVSPDLSGGLLQLFFKIFLIMGECIIRGSLFRGLFG